MHSFSSNNFAMSFQLFNWGCVVHFYSRELQQLCPSFSPFDLCQMLTLLCIFSFLGPTYLKKLLPVFYLSPFHQTLCHIAKPWWKPKNTGFQIFAHTWNKWLKRLRLCDLEGLGKPLSQVIDTSYWDAENSLSKSYSN